MLNMEMLEDIIYGLLKEARARYREVWIDRIKITNSKIFLYMIIGKEKVKVIIYRDNVRVRVYSRLRGLSISIQRIIEREYRKVLKRWKHERQEPI